MQSHGGQVRHLADVPRWCDDVPNSAGPARFARRSLLKAAVLGRREEPGHPFAAMGEDSAAASALMYTVTGTILDVSPHVLVLWTELGEQRFLLTSNAAAWRGGKLAPAALRRGDHAIVRREHPNVPVVDRIWAQAGRATGTIIDREGPATLLVDEGPGNGRKVVMIASEA